MPEYTTNMQRLGKSTTLYAKNRYLITIYRDGVIYRKIIADSNHKPALRHFTRKNSRWLYIGSLFYNAAQTFIDLDRNIVYSNVDEIKNSSKYAKFSSVGWIKFSFDLTGNTIVVTGYYIYENRNYIIFYDFSKPEIGPQPMSFDTEDCEYYSQWQIDNTIYIYRGDPEGVFLGNRRLINKDDLVFMHLRRDADNMIIV